jgi:hypothetical protein
MESWKPRLSGNKYCAPACGGGCTKAAYDKAVASAKPACSKDPNRAVRAALKHVEAKMADLNETLAAARKASGYGFKAGGEK